MFKRFEIQVPVNMSEAAIKANEITMLSILLYLKTLYEGGTIHNYKVRAKEISNACGIVKKTYIKYLNKLFEKGLVIEKDGSLLLSSFKTISRHYKVYYSRYLRYSLTFYSVKDLKLNLRTIAIKDNQRLQSLAIEHKLEKSLKNYSLKEHRDRFRSLRIIAKQSFNGFGDSVVLSQRGIAKLMGSTCASVGNYWSQKLSKQNKIATKNQTAILLTKECSREAFLAMRNANPELPIYQKNGVVYQHRPNLIKVKI